MQRIHSRGVSRRTPHVLAALSLTALIACPGDSTMHGFGTGTETGTGGPSSSGTDTGSTTAPTTGPGTGETTGAVTATSGETASGSTTMSLSPCTLDEDCTDSPDGPVCDVDQGVCGWPCAPGEQVACYDGPEGTADVGACASGVKTCMDSGLEFGPCEGWSGPGEEVCDNGVDDDCDGETDEDTDADGDGFGACSSDCCDAPGGTCLSPELVNPGAFEVVGNTVDDDCDGMTDEAAPSCDAGLASNSSDPLDYARAIDLCQTTTENPADPKDRTWGVISGAFSLADGKGLPAANSRAIRADFGALITPQKDARMAVLSSGHAADMNDMNPGYMAFEQGQNMNTTSPPPPDWWAAIGGKLPNPPGCKVPEVPSANDPIMLKLRIRVPTNARSFAAKMYFFSAEYPEWVCSQYNDFFVALVDSQGAGNPADKNVAIYDDGDTKWPIGVNLVKVADGLFTQCQGGTVGCQAGVPVSQYEGCVGTNELQGTGFDQTDLNACEPAQTMKGGGTGWLTLRGNVSPGEIMEIRLAIWDTGGHIFDSLVLLDAWEWSLEAAQPGVSPG